MIAVGARLGLLGSIWGEVRGCHVRHRNVLTTAEAVAGGRIRRREAEALSGGAVGRREAEALSGAAVGWLEA